jgi:hypothetical protein
MPSNLLVLGDQKDYFGNYVLDVVVRAASLYNLANKTNVVHNFSLYALFLFSTCFGRYVLIIRRIYSIKATSGICHSVLMTVWYAGWGGTSQPAYQTFLNTEVALIH